MLQGITQFERTHDSWETFLDNEGRTDRDPTWLRSKKWAGVISRHTTLKLVETCEQLGIPLVDLNDTPPFPGVPKIRPDNTALGHLGAEHFMERGFRYFAFCGFKDHGWSQERRDGYVEALELAGYQCPHVLEAPFFEDLNPSWDAQQTKAVASWLCQLPKPIAVLACNDMRAFQVVSAARSMEMLVPEDVAVLGMNNDAIRCELSDPSLSSVAPNPFQSGYQAAMCLSQLINGEKPEAVNVRIEPVGVVNRQSTDMFAIDDKKIVTALRFIRERACSGITVAQVLKHASVSRSRLEKKFRQHIKRSPNAEIRRVQITKIRQMLSETDYPLSRISELTGFAHVEYMYVVFKRITRETPGGFRSRTRVMHEGKMTGIRASGRRRC